MGLKPAIKLHEKVGKTRSNKNDIACYLIPMPIDEWKNNGAPERVHQSFINKLDEIIESAEEDVSSHTADLDEFTRGYDEGYLAGLNYAKILYNKED